MKLVMHQTRKPDWCQADLNALIASCRVAANRVVEMAARFGDDVYYSATQELLDRNHRAMKALIAMAVAEEPVSFSDYICDDGKGFGPYKIQCTMRREGEKVILDFDGTDPQSAASIDRNNRGSLRNPYCSAMSARSIARFFTLRASVAHCAS